MRTVLITGAGGFIGGHLAKRLSRHHHVIGVDRKCSDFRSFKDCGISEFNLIDLRNPVAARDVMTGVQDVFMLAADMGGMGFIADPARAADIFHDNMIIDLNTLAAAADAGVERVFYASSACVYPDHLQSLSYQPGLVERDAYPANPPDSYGWEKLMGERAVRWYVQQGAFKGSIARFHNVYGEYTEWKDPRAKAPAALCRKIAQAKKDGDDTIQIWGDGQQTRSFMYVADCVEGIVRLVENGYDQPINLGMEHIISINNLASLIAEIAGLPDLKFQHVDGPQGVRGRDSDNTLIKQVLGWEPQIPLRQGLTKLYGWVEKEVNSRRAKHA